MVNDALGLLKIVRPMLSGFGVARIRLYGDPKSALHSLLKDPPDLLLANDRMKPIDGSRFVRMMRHLDMGPLCFVPAVILSSWARRCTVERAFLAGAHQVLVLPVSPATLYRRIEWLLRDGRLMVREGRHYVIEGVEEIVATARAAQSHGRPGGKDDAREAVPPLPPAASLTEGFRRTAGEIWEI